MITIQFTKTDDGKNRTVISNNAGPQLILEQPRDFLLKVRADAEGVWISRTAMTERIFIPYHQEVI